MKTLMLVVFAFTLLFSFSSPVLAASYTHGYTRSNGTHVNGYYHTTSNYTVRDNYSTKGNYNPYTGKSGTRTYGGRY
ncbi:MAG: hypothetical protein JWL88_571 [Parcubacteria group bacterium]|nr:hypothetical protein [Parcubacteria group bacterium]